MHFKILSATLAISCTVFLLLYYLTTRLQRYFRLKHIPGPLTASWSNIWLWKVINYGNFAEKALDLDRKYGPVVRYSPNRVLFSQLEALPTIYGITNVMTKSDSTRRTATTFRFPSSPAVSARPSFPSDEKRVAVIRRHTSHAFSTTAILDYESHIDETIKVLTSNLRDSAPRVDLQQWLSYFAFDTICRLAFSDDAGMMNRQHDVGDTLRGGRTRFQYWSKWYAYPALEALLYKNPWVRGIVRQNILTSMAINRVQDRIQKGGAGTHDDLLDRYLQAQDKAPEVFDIPTITSITLSTIHAGSETTGHTLAHVFKDLFKNPHVYDQLKKLCREADFSSPPRFTEVKKIPFIEACVKESQRISMLIIHPSEREVPAGGATICGTYVPAGTVVAANHHALSLNPSIYAPTPAFSPVTQYDPSRWLQADTRQYAVMDKALLAFSTGKRSCLGIHLAWAEMLKVLPHLICTFDIAIADPHSQIMNAEGNMNNFVRFVDGMEVVIGLREV